MRLNLAFSPIRAALGGAILGWLAWTAYWNVSAIPDAAWPMIAASFLVHAIHATLPDLALLLFILIRALPLSILLGCIGGYLITRFKFPRVFCYSVFLWPLAYFVAAYYTIWRLDSIQQPYTQVLWRSWHTHQFVAFAVYGWLFIGLYTGAAIARRRAASASTM